MPGPLRDIVAEGVAGIVQSLPDHAKIVIQIQDIDRDTFDRLRLGEEVTFAERAGVWMSVVPLGSGVFLDLETRDEPSLKAVS